MDKVLNTPADLLRHLEDKDARILGEALAARLLAMFALDALLSTSPDPQKLCAQIEAGIDRTIAQMKMQTPAGEENNNSLDMLTQELARARCQEFLDALRRAHSR